MEGWKENIISDFGEVITGSTPSTKNNQFWENGDYPFYSPADFTDRMFCDVTEKCITKAGLLSGRAIYPNSVMVTCIASIGKMAVNTNLGITNQQINTIVINNDFDFRFIYYLLLLNTVKIRQIAPQTTVPILNKKNFSDLKFYLPSSINEQSKIANILSTVDTCITQTEQLIAKYKNIKQGLMHDLLTYGIDENGTIRNPQTHTFTEKNGLVVPEEWEVDKFDNLFRFYPTASYSRAELGIEGDFYCVHYGDIHTKFDSFLYADKENLPTITEKQSIRYMKLIDGDLVMADASEDYAGVGKSVEVLNTNDKQIIAGLHTLLIRSKNKKFVNGYRGYIFHNHAVKKLLDDVVTGWKVYSISKGRLPEIYIPIPTKREQLIIIKTLNAHNNLIESEQTNLAKLQNLKLGLMEDLLTGKVRVKI